MNLGTIQMYSLFLLFLLTSRICISISTHFTGDISINCGSNRASTVHNARPWLGDEQPKLSSFLQITGKSTTSTRTKQLTLDEPVPYKTARISKSKFSYVFQVDPGQKIIRLHFAPCPYKGFRGFKDFFTVQSGGFTLLRNFSASLAGEALRVKSFSKEFCLNVQQSQQLTITFSPENSQSLDAYAFINGIEILAVPAALSYFGPGDIGLQVVGEKSMVHIDNNTALEIIHRNNIKQDPVSSSGDSDNIFPDWATQELKKKKSSTWRIPVMVGFRYLVRLHFSEVGLKIAGTGVMKFEIFINEMIAQTNSDILTARDGNYFLYRDYIVIMAGLKTTGKRDILISILSRDELRDGHGVLSGFEVVKLSNHDNSLASPNPQPPPQDSPSKTRYLISILGHVNGTSTIAIAILSLINIIVYKLRDTLTGSSNPEENRPSDRAERLFTEFSLSEIQRATNNFNVQFLVGKGGFGNVYKGLLRRQDVAIKRLKPESNQGAHEFLTEIETLSELRHINLVPLIGYCQERGEMILVYEYMPNGTLADHLYKNARRNRNCSSLSLTWKQRLGICIEAGRGLDYLHTGHRIIHRDVKASNILLDKNLVAKVSDFGLAKPEDRNRLQSHVSTKVKGTFGYFDPYYMSTQRLTKKSDTYALGVVLFEVLCGRPAIEKWVLEEERVLINWVRHKISKGEVEDIVDSSLRQEVLPDSLKTFVEIAEKCLHDEPKNRPTMSQLVLQLELALEQQGNRILGFPYEITPAASDVSASNEDIITLSESAEQAWRAASPDMQRVVFSPAKQTNLNYSPADSSSRELRKPKKCSLLWCLSCCAIWSKTKQAREGFKLTEISGADTNSLKVDQTKVAVSINQSLALCRNFSLREIKKATGNFNESFLIGRGGFGNMYKGLLDDGATTVAIKRLNHLSDYVASEFDTLIRTLSELRHHHLVSLIGYCNEKREKILVYDYMEHGTLYYHLNKSGNSPLTWKQRLEICLGAAKGLDYLHTGGKHVVVHRDVKSANILLDENWVAKMSDFEAAKVIFDSDLYVSTVVQGTLGYLDPEYYLTARLTAKSDVYSFGVVLFEVLCARRPIIPSLPTKQVNLVEWGKYCLNKGKLDKIIDSNLKGQIAPKCLKEFFETAVACLSITGDARPVMRDVVRSLEFAMQLQEASSINEAPPLPLMMSSSRTVDTEESEYEHGLESTQKQKAKMLKLSSAKQSDDDSFS